MNKWLELLVGLILVIASVVIAYQYAWNVVIDFLVGAVLWGVLGLGLLFILLGISDLKG